MFRSTSSSKKLNSRREIHDPASWLEARWLSRARTQIIKLVLPNACESSKAQETTKLVFHRYGDQYFLAQVWTEGNDRGSELPKSGANPKSQWATRPRDVVVVAALR